MQIGVDPAEDHRRFHVTPKGRILVVPEMLGQHIHQLR
jgi:glucose-1-phosphate adenylyltransferase